MIELPEGQEDESCTYLDQMLKRVNVIQILVSHNVRRPIGIHGYNACLIIRVSQNSQPG